MSDTNKGRPSNEFIDAAADIGKGMATLKLIVGELIAVVLAAIGGYLLFHPETTTQNTVGTVKAAKTNPPAPNSTAASYTIDTVYTCNNVMFTNSFITNSPYAQGSSVDLQYNPSNCMDVRLKQTSNTTIGVGFIIVGLFLGIVSVAWWYAVTRNRNVAAFSGASDVLGAVTSQFRR